ncbi:preprotein translocase subunit YajC [Microterricola viridarii]|uniref:preprotein translocase subunit YajC n=1 Tax=Microterricola viridarii TaxID=412690 RepID=UPI001F1EBB48|nr:preprotein translocase subunit YajC [Microterricola viridarii]
MLAVLAVLIFFMFRNSRKRQKDAAQLQTQVVPGAKVMTNSGVFGTILSIDDEENEVLLETTPGTVLALHRQTIARVVTPVETAETVDAADSAIDEAAPEFGERIEDATTDSGDVDGSADKKSND